MTYGEEVEDVQSNSHGENLWAETVLKGSRNYVKYPRHSHDYGQLYDYGEVLKEAVRATKIKQFSSFNYFCKKRSPGGLYVFHGLPVAREIEGRHKEAEDIEGDDGEDDQVEVDKLWGGEEWFVRHILRSYEAGEFANVRKGGIIRFDWIHHNSEDSEACWDSLGEEKIHQETFQARFVVPSSINNEY